MERVVLERLSQGGAEILLPDPRTPAGAALTPIVRRAARAMERYNMVEEGDRVLVALSGGKDSWTALHAVAAVARRAPFSFHVAAVHVHGGVSRPAYETGLERMAERLGAMGVEAYLARTDVVARARKMADGLDRCFLCARFRRGVLYRLASQEGYSKLVLGHHADDSIETLLMNLFFTGQIKSMPPKLQSDDGRNTVIRPLFLVWEAETKAFAETADLPIVPSACGDREPDTRRSWTKELLEAVERDHPEAKHYVLAALSHVRPSHLADVTLWPFRNQDSADRERR